MKSTKNVQNTQNPDQEITDALNERAENFAKNFANAKYEMGDAQNFVRGLCDVYCLNPLRAVSFEQRLQKASGKGILRIDAFFPALLLVEMKSKGEDLEEAYRQALGYLELLKNDAERPKYILVSDFYNLHLYAVDNQKEALKIHLADFPAHENVKAFDFLLGYERIYEEAQQKANQEAAEKLGNLHDAIKNTGYAQEDLQTFLVRILFCLFADDTHIFDPKEGENIFQKLVKGSNSSGDDLGAKLDLLFRRLNTDLENKEKSAKAGFRTDGNYSYLLNFPYINGALFGQNIRTCYFDADSRSALIACCGTDWSEISPDIFGTLFQYIMHFDDEENQGKKSPKRQKRRDFGAHYTSEKNIKRAISPLFLDDLRDQLNAAKNDKKALSAFCNQLALLNIFDPACGCGNFLVVAYREIRALEQQAVFELSQIQGAQKRIPQCDVHQFHGIEIDPTAVEIATLALWLTDHQMNLRFADNFKRIPLKNKANIVCANALQTDWQSVIPAEKCSFIVGNPPFIGKTFQNAAQKADMQKVFGNTKNAGLLDYVGAWYYKALAQLQANPTIKAAFVSTNSITQGEQVAALWQPLIENGLHILFAHRTFKWRNEGRGIAAVHCVIIGFGREKPKSCAYWDYSENISGEGKKTQARRLNPYLVDAPMIALQNRSTPICKVSPMVYGSKPTDAGNLLLTDEDKEILLREEPAAEKWIRPFLGAEEFINGLSRWCLWLEEASETELFAIPKVSERVEKVQEMRLASPKLPTQISAKTPHLFQEIRHSKSDYLLVPSVSSERRDFIPIGFVSQNAITSNANLMIPNATHYDFAILSSTMHNAWMRAVCGRMKSDYRYSAKIVYNNFPWPKASAKQIKAIESAAQNILSARKIHETKPEYSLAWAYNPKTMQPNLKKAHEDLDALIDEVYEYEGKHEDADRVAFLFIAYQKCVEDEIKTKKTTQKPKT